VNPAWSTYFSTLAESAATLAGLLFVAVSINLSRVVAISGLPERALASITALVTIVVISVFGLLPQPPLAFGIELVVVGIVAFAGATRLRRDIIRSESLKYMPIHRLLRESLVSLITLPVVVAGVLETLGVPGALFWIVPPAIATILISILNAWVILVEIVR
jgi:hypothetical protein